LSPSPMLRLGCLVASACVVSVWGEDLKPGRLDVGDTSFYVTVPPVTPANVLVVSGATCHAKGACRNKGFATWHVLNESAPELAQRFIIAVSEDREVFSDDSNIDMAAGMVKHQAQGVIALQEDEDEPPESLRWSHSRKVAFIGTTFLEQLVTYDNVIPHDFRYLGTSKGAILMHSLLIENDDERISHVACVGAQLSPLLYRDGKFRVGGDANEYEEVKPKLVKRQVLQIMGSKDSKMPVQGGRADVPGPDDQEPYTVLNWEDSAFAYAKAYGHEGGKANAEMVTVAQYQTHVGAHGEDWMNKTATKASYLDGLVTAYVAQDASHSVETILDHAANVLSDFLMSPSLLRHSRSSNTARGRQDIPAATGKVQRLDASWVYYDGPQGWPSYIPLPEGGGHGGGGGGRGLDASWHYYDGPEGDGGGGGGGGRGITARPRSQDEEPEP